MFQLIQRQGSSRSLMALLNNDGLVAKAWHVHSVDAGRKLIIGHPDYGPLEIGKAEPVNLQFGNFGITTSSRYGMHVHNLLASSSMEPQVIDIDDVPMSSDQMPKTVSKRKGKRREVPVHEIIDVDMDEDPNDVVFILGKAKSTKKTKGAMGISLGSGSSVESDSKKVMSDIKEKLGNLRKFGNDEGMRKCENFKKFDTVPPMNWAKITLGDWKILEKDLPDTIFVRVYESRMDLLRAAIIGAEGTPYHDGLFFFDVCFLSTYPQKPPLVHYHSGGLRINLNLNNWVWF
uniref:UBC core domain-containing protein n=1 Tax=Tanacetum cinerariifolium TaxID=118510 RepID=A0A6L2MNI9_TANCI|nr:hypothetical protein [Tanacetum cinerariifolium]